MVVDFRSTREPAGKGGACAWRGRGAVHATRGMDWERHSQTAARSAAGQYVRINGRSSEQHDRSTTLRAVPRIAVHRQPGAPARYARRSRRAPAGTGCVAGHDSRLCLDRAGRSVRPRWPKPWRPRGNSSWRLRAGDFCWLSSSRWSAGSLRAEPFVAWTRLARPLRVSAMGISSP